MYNTQCLCYGILPLLLFAMACAGYAYLVDARRPADDPQKRNYRPLAIVFAPITLPIFIVLSILIFMMRVLLYGVFLILFPFVLIIARKPFLLLWLAKKATSIGNKLLDANTMLITLFLKLRVDQPEIKKSPYPLDSLVSRFI
jgi:hypothetical protein